MSHWLLIVFSAISFSATTLLAQADIKRWPVPTAEAISEATKVVTEVYRNEYTTAKTPEQKSALVKKLLTDGENTTDDQNTRYALIDVARKLAVQEDDFDVACHAIDVQAKKFDVDVLSAKLQVVSEVAARVKDPTRAYDLLIHIHDLLEESLAEFNIDHANTLNALLPKVAARIPDAKVRKQTEVRCAEVDEILAQLPSFQAAQSVLANKPADGPANLDVGLYWLLMDKWDKALPYLALSSEGPLQEIAELELRGGSAANEAMALADKWWELAKSAKGLRGAQYQARAMHHIKARWTAFSPLARTKFTHYVEDYLEENKDSMVRWQGYRLERATPTPWHVRLHPPVDGSSEGSISPIVDPEGMLDISVTARTLQTSIRIDAYGKALVIFNWEVRADELRVHRPDGSQVGAKFIPLQLGRFYNLRWIYAPKAMGVYVNGRQVFTEPWRDNLPPNTVRVHAFDGIVDVSSISIVPVKN